MKEIKNFFNKDIKLNKGYASIPNKRDTNSENYQKKFSHILPPIDLITEFEDIYPGTLARIMEMSENEQHHSHALDIASTEAQSRNAKFGRVCAVIIVAFICFTTLLLAVLGQSMVAIFFACFAFLSIAAIYCASEVATKPKKLVISPVTEPAEIIQNHIKPNSNFKGRRKIR
ncbi:MAG: DUF2335 domain-containing protein [Janthinobacterium lividum]